MNNLSFVWVVNNEVTELLELNGPVLIVVELLEQRSDIFPFTRDLNLGQHVRQLVNSQTPRFVRVEVFEYLSQYILVGVLIREGK